MLWLGAVLLLSGQAAEGAAPKPPSTEPVITNPDWLRRPTQYQLRAVIPARAVMDGQSGSARISCSVTQNGGLAGCVVLDETPQGFGFGAAAILLTPQFRLRPLLIDGVPVSGATVVIPVTFLIDSDGSTGTRVRQRPSRRNRTLVRPRWEAAPTRAQVAEASTVAGFAALRCRVTGARTLQRCQVIAQDPVNQRLGDAARSLSGHFRLAAPQSAEEVSAEGAEVDVRLLFGGTPIDVVEAPTWIRTPPGDAVENALRPIATPAPEQTARATVECTVGGNGALEACAVVSASPAAAGPVVAELATRFAVPVWSEDGGSTVGARVLLPLRYVAD